jgi:hypothetical protein
MSKLKSTLVEYALFNIAAFLYFIHRLILKWKHKVLGAASAPVLLRFVR